MLIQATQLRPGMIIIHEGQLYRVFAVHHLTPGNKRGFYADKDEKSQVWSRDRV